MTAKHTPGPWGCASTGHEAHDYRLTKPNGDYLPVNAPCNDHSEQRANARLIAAAPDLLAACLDLLPFARAAVRDLSEKMVGNLYPAINEAMLQRAEQAIVKVLGGMP